MSVFPDEIYAALKSWTEKAYPKLIYYNRLPKGGHFAAWEQPQLFTRRSGRHSDHCADNEMSEYVPVLLLTRDHTKLP